LKNDLKALLRECHNKGYLTNEFAIEALKIAHIHVAKKDRSYCHQIKEETISHFSSKLVRKWRLLKPEKSPFSYLNSMAYTSLLDISKKEHAYKNKKEFLRQFTLGKLNKQDTHYDNDNNT